MYENLLRLTRLPTWKRRSNVSHTACGILPGEEMMLAISTESVIRTNNIPSGNTHTKFCKARVGLIPSYGSTNDRKKKKQDFGWCFLMVHTACGILPGEEMVLAVSTESVISRNYIPSGKQVRRAREKRLITVFS